MLYWLQNKGADIMVKLTDYIDSENCIKKISFIEEFARLSAKKRRLWQTVYSAATAGKDFWMVWRKFEKLSLLV